jgi:hypothetical protein
MKRQRRTVGALLSVPLGDGTNCYALTLPKADFAFFDLRSGSAEESTHILSRPILFRVAVHKSAWATGRWPKISKVEVPRDLLEPQPTFMQDAIHPERFSIYLAGHIRQASRAECEGLERCAVWEPEHVEDRLRDHFEGKPNVWVESLRLK